MATRKLEIQTNLHKMADGIWKWDISREFVISLQPQGYDWTILPRSILQIIYDTRNAATTDNELIEVQEEDNRTILKIYSDDPVVEVFVNGIRELESKIVNWPERTEISKMNTRNWKVQNSLGNTLEVGLEPYGWYWHVKSGSVLETNYLTDDSESKSDILILEYFSNGKTSLTIESGDKLYEFYIDGEKH